MFVLGDAGAGGLLLTGSTFDEDGGQSTEDERLNAAAEPVEIQARKGRDADLEQLELAQEAGQPAEHDMAQACQRPVQQGGNDRTGQDIAKVTERHADGVEISDRTLMGAMRKMGSSSPFR